KANLYARVRGDGSARPLIFLNHMDVVLASPEYWKVAPFGGVVNDGYVWRRVALDMKGEATAQPMTLITLKRAGVRPTRDVLLLTAAVERYFRDLATIERDPSRRAWFADIRGALRDSAAVRALTADLTYNALLRNTISITGLRGSDQTNVIPPVATAAIDVRL